MESYIKEIINRHFPSFTGSVEALQGGIVGHIFRITQIDTSSLILKVNKQGDQKNTTEESVYGSNPDHFKESYRILEKNDIPRPDIVALGSTNDKKYSYIIMQDFVGDRDDYSDQWFKEVGHWLGRLHSIKKSYDDQWLEFFKHSLYSRFENLKAFLKQDLSAKIEIYIQDRIQKVQPAQFFCFSHLDGFQGILKKHSDAWQLLGVIDVEDHQYTDQRFVLAGFELNNEMKGNSIPEIFWEEYRNHAAIDETFEDTKALFKLYYLLVWSFVLKDNSEKFHENLATLRYVVNSGL